MPVYPPNQKLGMAEQRDLAARIKAGDREARETMILANLGMVVNIAKRYCSHGATFDDLVQEGNSGLIYAVDRYDPEKHNASFSTYAYPWIRCMIQRAVLANFSLIHVPEYLFRKDARSHQVDSERLEQSIISQSLHLEVDENGKEISFEETLPDRDQPEQDLEIAEKLEKLHVAIDELTPIERWTISQRFGLGDDLEKRMSYRQIAKMTNTSFSTVRRTGDSALRKLRKWLRSPCDCV